MKYIFLKLNIFIIIISFLIPVFNINAEYLSLDYINLKIKSINTQISQLEQSKKSAENYTREILAQNGALRTDSNADNVIKNAGSKYQSQIDLLEINKEYWTKLKKQYNEELEQNKIVQEERIQKANEILEGIDNKINNLDSLCKENHGINTYYNAETEECICNSGYFINKSNKCITLSSLCTEKYGSRGFIKDSKCYYCSEGYSYDKNKKDCVSKEAIKPIEKTTDTTKNTNKDLSYGRYLKQKENKIDDIKTGNIKNDSIPKKVLTFFKKMLFWGKNN